MLSSSKTALQGRPELTSHTQFGHGSRGCVGKNIALLEITKFVPEILRHFDVEWASPKPEWNTFSEWFYKQSDVVLRFTSRTKETEV